MSCLKLKISFLNQDSVNIYFFLYLQLICSIIFSHADKKVNETKYRLADYLSYAKKKISNINNKNLLGFSQLVSDLELTII